MDPGFSCCRPGSPFSAADLPACLVDSSCRHINKQDQKTHSRSLGNVPCLFHMGNGNGSNLKLGAVQEYHSRHRHHRIHKIVHENLQHCRQRQGNYHFAEGFPPGDFQAVRHIFIPMSSFFSALLAVTKGTE